MAIDSNERKSIEYLFPHFENPIIFDVGSNKGDWAETFHLSDLKDYSLIMFEPNRMLLDYTRIRYAYNKKMKFEELAVSKSDDKEVPFYYFTNENNELSSLYYNKYLADMPMQKGVVKTITIDTYCKRNNIDHISLLKIDTEGGELDVLNGCKEMLANDKIDFLQVEYGGLYKISGIKFADVFDFIEPFGYSFYEWNGDEYVKMNKESFIEDFRLENFIITKKKISNQSNGWIAQFKKNTVDLPKFDFILEVGCFEGLTTKYMCENMLIEGGRIICVDPLDNCYTKEDTEHKELFDGQYERFIANTKGLPIELYREKSETAFPKMNAYRFGFIYVDGDHSEDAVYFDCVWAIAVCKIGGYILIDDLIWRDGTTIGVERFLQEFGGFVDIVVKNYQILLRKTADAYNHLTSQYYL